MSLASFNTLITDRYFEDYPPGATFEFGPIEVDQAEVVSFAKRFDPQLMHTDPEWAANGPFHGLIASGWHTIGLMMRLLVDHYLSANASLASPGVDEVRWLLPVRPGDRLMLRVSIAETRASRSKPDRGLVISHMAALNQDGAIVCSFKAMNLLGKRNETPI
jgi:acyl dehydratase